MKLKIKDALGLFNAVQQLKSDQNLSIRCKMSVVELMEDLNAALKPFMTIRNDLQQKHSIKGKDGKSTLNKEELLKEIEPVVEEEIELKKDSFVLDTTQDDKIITTDVLAILKKIYADKFSIKE